MPSLATGPDSADTFIGGANGTAGGRVARGDRIFMSTRLDSLHYDLGGGAKKSDSDGDDVRNDVEDLTGGQGADVLIGNPQDNLIDGRQGNDSLSGGARTGPDGADLAGGTDEGHG